MYDDFFSDENQNKVDFLTPPESTPNGGPDFSAKTQREKFLGGGPKKRLGRFVERIGIGTKLATEMFVKSPKVEGLENLTEIPKGQKVVFATDHISDISEAAAVQALSPYRKLSIASLETNQKDFKQAILMHLVGRGRFYDVKNTFDEENDMPHTDFDPNNYEEMKKAMKRSGSDMVVSAHRPVRRTEMGALPNHREGIGAVYLAQYAADADEKPIVVPVALDVHSDERIGMAYKDTVSAVKGEDRKKEKPDATLRIGTPMQLEKIPPEDLKEIALLLTNRNAFNTITSVNGEEVIQRDQERYQKARSNYAKLREQSKQVMKAIAQLLPEEKQSKWKEESSAPEVENPTENTSGTI